MGRPGRLLFPDAHYHVLARGNGGNDIFHDETDRYAFLEVLEEIVERYHWVIYTWCLMQNHVHLVLRTPRPNLAEGMRGLLAVYARSFHSRHNSYGHLFGGRYVSHLLEPGQWTGDAIRYVDLNPVRAGLVSLPVEYRWSGCAANLGLVEPRPPHQPDETIALFGDEPLEGITRYAAYLRSGAGDGHAYSDQFTFQRSVQVYGSRDFKRNVRRRLERQQSGGSTRQLRRMARAPLTEIFDAEALTSRAARNRAIHQAVVKEGYTQKEISTFLDLDPSTISRVLSEYSAGA